MSSTAALKEKARFLRNASPRAYDDFCEVFASYSHGATTAMLMSNENLQLHQGHAQQCLKILAALEEVKND